MTTYLTKIAARMLIIPIFLVALGIMVKGYADIGDGFSAGVIASLGIALQVMVFGPAELTRLPLVQLAPKGTFLGVFIALLTAFVPAVRGEPLMRHWPPAGDKALHFGTLEFITAVAFDVGVFLVVFGFGVGVIASIARSQARMTEAEERANMRAERTPTARDAT
jgi:multisubunit Na+/H+ antiporter MnhB subunit